MSLELRVGQILTWNGREFDVGDVDSNGAVLLIARRYGGTRRVTLEQVQDALRSAELSIDDSTPTAMALAPRLQPGSANSRAEVERRRRYVMEAAIGGAPASKADLANAIRRVAAKTGDAKPPSVTTVYRWLKRFRTSGKEIATLGVRYAACGNRSNRYGPELMAMFDAVIDEEFLRINKPTAKEAYAKLGDRVCDANLNRKTGRIKMPSYKSFCAWIRYRVDPYWLIARREGHLAAIRRFRGCGDGVVSTYPLERVEIDHTVMDVIVVHPVTGEPIGRPTLTWALDHYSRVILGFYISLQPPSSTLVLCCLKQVMQDKSSSLRGNPRLAGFFWSMHGVPVMIVVDNGADFHSDHFKEACARFGISIQYCPPGQPWFKGRVERFVRTLNTGLLHLLPGSTRSNPKDRGAYKSEQLASLTLEELQRLVTEWIVAEYHERRHRTLGDSPRSIWEAGVALQPPVMVANPKTLDLDLAMSVIATISGNRVQFRNLRFGSPALAALGLRLGKQRKVEVLYRPEDISCAYVRDPIHKALIEVPCITQGISPGMSLDAFELLRRVAANSAPSDPIGSVNAAARALREEIAGRHESAVKALEQKRRAKRAAKRQTNSSLRPASSTAEVLNRKERARLESSLPREEVPLPRAKRRDAAQTLSDPFSHRLDRCVARSFDGIDAKGDGK